MACKTIFILFCATMVNASQSREHAPGHTDNSQMNDSSIAEIIVQGIPIEAMDRLALTALNDSKSVVPKLVTLAKESGSDTTEVKNRVARIVDVLAYVGDSVAIEGIKDLVRFDSARFSYVVGRSIDYCWGRRNPFSFLYALNSSSNRDVQREIRLWVRNNARANGRVEAMSLALLERYHTEQELQLFADTDPILASVDDVTRRAIRDAVHVLSLSTGDTLRIQ